MRNILVVISLIVLCSCTHKPIVPVTLTELQINGEISGRWLKGHLLEVSSLSVSKDGEEYQVTLHSSGCVGEENFSTRATYSDGIIRLKTPIQEYSSDPYDTIYVLRLDKHTYLVPSVESERLLTELNENRRHVIQRYMLQLYAFSPEKMFDID